MKAGSKPPGCMVKCVLNPVNGLGKALAQNRPPCGVEMVCIEQPRGFDKTVLIASALGDEKADAELSL